MLSEMDIFVFTFNMARCHQEIDFDLIVNQDYDMVVWGAQECLMSEKEMQVA